MLGDAVSRVGPRQAVLGAVFDGPGKTLAPSVPIFPGASRGWSFRALRKNRFAASRSRLAVKEEIDRSAMLVDGAVEIALLAADFYIGFVDTDRAAIRTRKLA